MAYSCLPKDFEDVLEIYIGGRKEGTGSAAPQRIPIAASSSVGDGGRDVCVLEGSFSSVCL